MLELPEYKCIKRVRAVKIKKINHYPDGRTMITPDDEGFEEFLTRKGWIDRYDGSNADLGYYVEYKDDFTSWSPSKAFEEGYVRVVKSV